MTRLERAHHISTATKCFQDTPLTYLGLHLQKESNGLAPYSRKNNQLSRLSLHFVGLLSIHSLEMN